MEKKIEENIEIPEDILIRFEENEIIDIDEEINSNE